jgi:hypothetical protein
MLDSSLTVGGSVQYNEACIDGSRISASLPLRSVCVSTQAVCSFVEIDIMVGPVQCPKSRNTGATTANDGYPLPSSTVNGGAHDQIPAISKQINIFERCKNAPVGRGGDNDDDIDAGKQANSQVESRESCALLLECPE